MKADGRPISDYRFQKPPILITYSLAYELEQARLYAGIPFQEWVDMPGSPVWCRGNQQSKAEILVLYRMQNYIRAVAEDATTKKKARR